ncbi:TPA: hypothetical protein IAD41_01240 [Candidatus Scatenecus faecavium]|uniref:Uncharacterized protein n=1 Tax=Candidatus Scatenecus faecavium TaxID=2840915 RepID=A0A9D1FUK0_9BACT|nr:hypothetical protein [Candidatus Scatenecus faecavium]
MQLATLNANTVKAGTCPHGLPLGACPICNGMGGGGGMRKADFSAKPGEMSWNECAAIGAFLKAQANAKARRQQDLQNYALQMQNFQTSMVNARARVAELAQFFTQNTPAIIAKPVNFVLNTVLGGTLNIIKNLPAAIQTAFQTIQQKFADISDKLTAMMGELKAAVEKKISETFSELKKKVKSLFTIFSPLDAENEDKQIDETKKTFELRTFIHELYKKLTENEKDLEDNGHL